MRYPKLIILSQGDKPLSQGYNQRTFPSPPRPYPLAAIYPPLAAPMTCAWRVRDIARSFAIFRDKSRSCENSAYNRSGEN